MKAPAFQFYPQDFISSLDVQVMTVEQIGGYWLLLTNAWIHDPQGYLPNNDLLLQRICRMNDKQWSKNKSIILKKFEKDDEYIFNQRLLRELEKQGEYRKKQAQNGAKGGRPKANDNPEKAVGYSGLTQTEPKKSSSISSSISSSSSNILLEKESKSDHDLNGKLKHSPPEIELPSERRRKAAHTGAAAEREHLFKDSEFFDFQKFKAAFSEELQSDIFPNVNLHFYYEAVRDWSEANNKKKISWIAQARTFMRSDKAAGKLQTIKNNQQTITQRNDAYTVKRNAA